MSKWIKMVVALAVASMAVGCAAEVETPATDPELVRHLDDNFGLRMHGWVDDADRMWVAEDGAIVGAAEGVMAIDGLGERLMKIEQRVAPAAAGGAVALQISDPTSGESRAFVYDFEARSVTFAAPEKGAGEAVSVQRNADGTFDVWTADGDAERVTVADGYAAMQRVDGINRLGEAPAHVLMTAVALGHAPSPEARTPSACDDTAAAPTACALFSEFCGCVACRVLETSKSCNLCPRAFR